MACPSRRAGAGARREAAGSACRSRTAEGCRAAGRRPGGDAWPGAGRPGAGRGPAGGAPAAAARFRAARHWSLRAGPGRDRSWAPARHRRDGRAGPSPVAARAIRRCCGRPVRRRTAGVRSGEPEAAAGERQRPARDGAVGARGLDVSVGAAATSGADADAVAAAATTAGADGAGEGGAGVGAGGAVAATGAGAAGAAAQEEPVRGWRRSTGRAPAGPRSACSTQLRRAAHLGAGPAGRSFDGRGRPERPRCRRMALTPIPRSRARSSASCWSNRALSPARRPGSSLPSPASTPSFSSSVPYMVSSDPCWSSVPSCGGAILVVPSGASSLISHAA